MNAEEFEEALTALFAVADERHGEEKWVEDWKLLHLAIRERHEPRGQISTAFRDVPPAAYDELLNAFRLAFT